MARMLLLLPTLISINPIDGHSFFCNAFQLQQQHRQHQHHPTATTSLKRTSTSSKASSIATSTLLHSDRIGQIPVTATTSTYEQVNPQLENSIKQYFPNAITNVELMNRVVMSLQGSDITSENTIPATSLCSDELAKKLTDDFATHVFNKYNIFVLGGLAGFPFAGNIGFDTLAQHIPDNGYCFIIYGPHIGITSDGNVIGKVERQGVQLVDDCCRSAILAMNHIMNNGGTASSPDDIMLDFQQTAVQNVMQPILTSPQFVNSPNHPILNLPYALFNKQDELLRQIIQIDGRHKIKAGIILLGGIQINTAPNTPDYFQPIKYNIVGNDGNVIVDLISKII